MTTQLTITSPTILDGNNNVELKTSNINYGSSGYLTHWQLIAFMDLEVWNLVARSVAVFARFLQTPYGKKFTQLFINENFTTIETEDEYETRWRNNLHSLLDIPSQISRCCSDPSCRVFTASYHKHGNLYRSNNRASEISFIKKRTQGTEIYEIVRAEWHRYTDEAVESLVKTVEEDNTSVTICHYQGGLLNSPKFSPKVKMADFSPKVKMADFSPKVKMADFSPKVKMADFSPDSPAQIIYNKDNGTISLYWYKNGQSHRESAPNAENVLSNPAIMRISKDGQITHLVWMENNLKHRVGLPAEITANSISFYNQGKLHSYDDKPSTIKGTFTNILSMQKITIDELLSLARENTTFMTWHKYGCLHRARNKPAVISQDEKRYYSFGYLYEPVSTDTEKTEI
jgi:hypothetical protein